MMLAFLIRKMSVLFDMIYFNVIYACVICLFIYFVSNFDIIVKNNNNYVLKMYNFIFIILFYYRKLIRLLLACDWMCVWIINWRVTILITIIFSIIKTHLDNNQFLVQQSQLLFVFNDFLSFFFSFLRVRVIYKFSLFI